MIHKSYQYQVTTVVKLYTTGMYNKNVIWYQSKNQEGKGRVWKRGDLLSI